MANKDPRNFYLLYNTLASLPSALVNKSVLIDLRNETSVAGTIDDVDGYENKQNILSLHKLRRYFDSSYMNIRFSEAVFIDEKGLQYPIKSYMVASRQIRQFHIPEDVSLFTASLFKFESTSTVKSLLCEITFDNSLT